MTLYAVFYPKPGLPDLPAVVPDAFSWFAAIMPPIFLLRHGLWLETFAWVLALAALVVVSNLAALPVVGLYLPAAAWFGFAAPGLRRHALQSRGWRHRHDRVAVSADMARLDALR